jgi:hypothetical protein
MQIKSKKNTVLLLYTISHFLVLNLKNYKNVHCYSHFIASGFRSGIRIPNPDPQKPLNPDPIRIHNPALKPCFGV